MRRQRPDLVREYEAEIERAEHIRTALTTGNFPGMGTGDPDLYKAFVWRFWRLCRKHGTIGIVLPRSVFATKGSAPWRQEVLPNADVRIVLTKNKAEWLFTDVNPGYSICLVGITKNPLAPSLSLRGTYTDAQTFREGMQVASTALPVDRLGEVDPLLCVPAIEDQEGLRLFNTLIEHPSLGNVDRPDFRVLPTAELHATKHGKLYFTGDANDHPVHNHLNMGHYRFEPNAGAFNYACYKRVVGDLQAQRIKLSRRADSVFSHMPQKWIRDETTLPAANPRIAFRDVIHASNPRKVWATLVPARTLLTNKAPYLVFPRGGLTTQAYLLGVLGSSTCDWYGHLRVVLNLNYFILNALPVPVFHPADPRCQRIAELAARIATGTGSREYGDWTSFGAGISDPCDIDAALAELDALATLLYGIGDEHVDLIFNRATRPSRDEIDTWRVKWIAQMAL